MSIPTYVINQAKEILEREGILFEDSSEIGSCLRTSVERAELTKVLKEHFKVLDKSVECQSLCICSRGEYYYYIFVWQIFETMYPDNMFYREAIKISASNHYNVKIDEISYEFI